MKGKGKNLVEEWSKQCSPTFTRSNGVVIDNPNIKSNKLKPDILTKEWSEAMKWEGKRHKIKFMQVQKYIALAIAHRLLREFSAEIYVAATNITVPKKRGRPPKILIDYQSVSTCSIVNIILK